MIETLISLSVVIISQFTIYKNIKLYTLNIYNPYKSVM